MLHKAAKRITVVDDSQEDNKGFFRIMAIIQLPVTRILLAREGDILKEGKDISSLQVQLI